MVKVRKRRPAPRVVKGKSGASYGTTQGPKGRAAQQKFRSSTQAAVKFLGIDFGKPGQQSKAFELMPSASAAIAPTGLIVKGVGTAAKMVVKSTTKQTLGKTSPYRGSTLKSQTYLNQVRAGVMPSTGGGVPKFTGYPDAFAVMQSGKIDTRLLNVAGINKPNVAGGTRTYQAAVTGAPGSVKHQVKKKSFVKIKAGGPVLEFPGGTQTRYKKRTYQTVTTPSNLVQGQDPLTKKHGLDVFMASGAVAAPVAASSGDGFWDQASNFFNPFPQAHAVSPTAAAGTARYVIQKFIGNNPQAKWAAFQTAHPDQIKKMGITKSQFLKDLKLTQKVTRKPGGTSLHTSSAFKDVSARKSAALMGGSIAIFGGGAIAAPTIAPWLDPAAYTGDKWGEYKSMQDEAAGLATGAGAGVTITSPSELLTDVAVPGQATLEERTTMQETALLNLGFDAHGQPIPSEGKAGPHPTIKYGLPSEQGKIDPNYTKITYQKWDGKKMVEASQWVKLGISGVTPTKMTEILNRQAIVGQTNTVYIEAQKNIRLAAAKSKSGNPLLATAQAAKDEYARLIEFGGSKVAVSSVIGQLPQQYKTILQRGTGGGGMQSYKDAMAWQMKSPYQQPYGHPDDGTVSETIRIIPSGYTPDPPASTQSDGSTSKIHSDK